MEGTGDFPGITLDLGDRWLDEIAASAAPSHSRIWDSYPKVRFAADSPVEGAGFEPSVPRKMGYRFETAFVASLRVPILPKTDSPSSRPGAEGLNPHSFCRCPREEVGSDHCRAGWSMARASVAICRTQLFLDHRLQCDRLRIRRSPCSAQKAGSAALASLSKFLVCTRVANARPAAIRRRTYRTK